MVLGKKTTELATMIILIIGLGYLFYRTNTFPPSMLPGYPGDAFFPRLVLGFTIICCASVAYKIIRARYFFKEYAEASNAGRIDTITIDPIQLVFMIALVLAFTFLLPVIGFELCVFLYLFILLITRWHGDLQPRLVKVGVLSLFTALFFYVAFVIFLNVSFPVKILPGHIQIF